MSLSHILYLMQGDKLMCVYKQTIKYNHFFWEFTRFQTILLNYIIFKELMCEAQGLFTTLFIKNGSVLYNFIPT
jgi:hypothetical protein